MRTRPLFSTADQKKEFTANNSSQGRGYKCVDITKSLIGTQGRLQQSHAKCSHRYMRYGLTQIRKDLSWTHPARPKSGILALIEPSYPLTGTDGRSDMQMVGNEVAGKFHQSTEYRVRSKVHAHTQYT